MQRTNPTPKCKVIDDHEFDKIKIDATYRQQYEGQNISYLGRSYHITALFPHGNYWHDCHVLNGKIVEGHRSEAALSSTNSTKDIRTQLNVTEESKNVQAPSSSSSSNPSSDPSSNQQSLSQQLEKANNIIKEQGAQIETMSALIKSLEEQQKQMQAQIQKLSLPSKPGPESGKRLGYT
jgi:predicted RNase H-like nuclease (RuvC/YqgF family)